MLSGHGEAGGGAASDALWLGSPYSLPGSYGTWSRITANTMWHSFLATAVTATRWGLPSARFLS